MDKKSTLAFVGSMQQLASVRPVIYQEGRASNLTAYQVKNGPIQFTVMTGKSLDIADFSFKGVNLNFLSKPGLTGRNHYDTHGQEALRSIMGGMFFTCGLENICASCVDEGKEYPMHGRMRTTPAEHIGADARWIDESFQITIQGEMREAELFGENMVLRRKIETTYGTSSIKIIDEVTNENFRSEPLMLMYHFNAGYPFLAPGCELVIPTMNVKPREDLSKTQVDRWNIIDPPRENEPEYVFIHELAADTEGKTFVALWNPMLEIGFKLSFNLKEMPHFYQWKSTAAGDYVMGLEPANASVYGRLYHSKQNNLPMLPPHATKKVELEIELFDQIETFREIKQMSKHIVEN